MKQCKHENGWYTCEATMFYSHDDGCRVYSDIMKTTHEGKVRVRCNVNGCHSVRNLYFKQGRFMKAGRPFVPKAK